MTVKRPNTSRYLFICAAFLVVGIGFLFFRHVRQQKKILGETTWLAPEASSEAVVSESPDLAADSPNQSPTTRLLEERRRVLCDQTAGVYELISRETVDASIVTGYYRLDVSPALTIAAATRMTIETDGVTETVDLPASTHTSYTTYQSSDDAGLQARTYSLQGDAWVYTSKPVNGEAQKILGHHLWELASLPEPDGTDRLTAPGVAGGTYQFEFQDLQLTKVIFTSGDGRARMEYLPLDEKPQTQFPPEIAANATSL